MNLRNEALLMLDKRGAVIATARRLSHALRQHATGADILSVTVVSAPGR